MLAALPTLVLADLRLPPKPTMMEKLGRGVANVTLSVSELFDSPYIATQEGGGTYGDTFGFTQGLSRMIMDTGVDHRINREPLQRAGADSKGAAHLGSSRPVAG